MSGNNSFETKTPSSDAEKEKECQKNLAGHFTDETNPGFIIPEHLLSTKTHN